MAKTLDYATWVKTFKPILNPKLTTNFDGYMFETFGEDIEYLKSLKKPGLYYWTLLAEGDELSIVGGVKWINRLGYFVTKKPWNENDPVYVDL